MRDSLLPLLLLMSTSWFASFLPLFLVTPFSFHSLSLCLQLGCPLPLLKRIPTQVFCPCSRAQCLPVSSISNAPCAHLIYHRFLIPLFSIVHWTAQVNVLPYRDNIPSRQALWSLPPLAAMISPSQVLELGS